MSFAGDPSRVYIDATETTYWLDIVNRYFRRGVTEADIAWSYAGVRPLYDDAAGNASTVIRDYGTNMLTPPQGPA